MLIRVTESELQPDEAIAAVQTPASGAVNLFLGVVRNNNLGRSVGYLEYDAYPAMACLLYTSPSPRDRTRSRMPSSA